MSAERGLLVAGVTAPGGGGGVDRDSVQPGRKGRIAPERRQTSPHPNPGLLGDIGGELVIVGEAKGKPVDLAAMPLEQLGERRAITLAGQRNQFRIIG